MVLMVLASAFCANVIIITTTTIITPPDIKWVKGALLVKLPRKPPENSG